MFHFFIFFFSGIGDGLCHNVANAVGGLGGIATRPAAGRAVGKALEVAHVASHSSQTPGRKESALRTSGPASNHLGPA